FSYQILQGNDFRELFRRYGCTLQTGGNDQWGNLLSGVDLVHKAEGASVHAMTTPLITKADGTKFGKTEGGAVWLAPDMMSPYAFFQFWLNTADADVVGYLKVFTFLDRERIGELEAAVAERPQAREAQRVLAREVTTLVHGADACERVEAASAALFGRGDLRTLDEGTLADAVAEVPRGRVTAGETTIVDALVATGLSSSRNEARRTVGDGGAYRNNEKITDPDRVIGAEDLLAGGVALVRRGRRTLAVGPTQGCAARLPVAVHDGRRWVLSLCAWGPLPPSSCRRAEFGRCTVRARRHGPNSTAACGLGVGRRRFVTRPSRARPLVHVGPPCRSTPRGHRLWSRPVAYARPSLPLGPAPAHQA